MWSPPMLLRYPTDKVWSALRCRNRRSWSPTSIHWRLSTRGVSDRYLMYAGGFMSPMQRCFSDLVCQPLVTSYVIDACLCLAMFHAWTLEYQHMMLCVWWWIPTKAERQCQLENAAGSPSQRLAQQDSEECQRSTAAIYVVEIWDRRGHEAAQRSLGLSEDDDDNDDVVDDDDDEGWTTCQKWKVKLIFQGRLFRTGIVEYMKIIDVEAEQKCIFLFSAVNENADENEIPFSAEKRKRVTCAYITELSYGSVAKITFSALCKWQFRNENEK